MAVGILLRPLALTSASPIPPSSVHPDAVDVGGVVPWSCSVRRVQVLAPDFRIVSLTAGGGADLLGIDTRGARASAGLRSYEIAQPMNVRIGEVLRVMVSNVGDLPAHFEAQLLCQ